MSLLLEPFQLSKDLRLPNRIVMAPMTRCMAGAEGVPTEAMAAYYARRAAAGLLITEATVVSRQGLGYPAVPGLYSEEQVAGWFRVTNEVHRAGGRIFAQLWHTGRAAHSYFSGEQPVGPSAVPLVGTVPRMRRLEYEMPRAMEAADFERVRADFRTAAENAALAGFDGVELHGANGYLIDQFLHHASNLREDEYGGTIENQARFPLEVVDELLDALGELPLGVRVSPAAHSNMVGDARDREVFDFYLRELGRRRLAYVHLGLFDDGVVYPELGVRASDYLRAAYPGVVVGVGQYTPSAAEEALESRRFDLMAFGRAFLANPDLVERVARGEPLLPYDASLLMRLI